MSFCLGYIGDINKGHSDLKTVSFCVIFISVMTFFLIDKNNTSLKQFWLTTIELYNPLL